MDWEHASEWRTTPAEVWEVEDERAGSVQAVEPLTYVKLDSAGHLVHFRDAYISDFFLSVLTLLRSPSRVMAARSNRATAAIVRRTTCLVSHTVSFACLTNVAHPRVSAQRCAGQVMHRCVDP